MRKILLLASMIFAGITANANPVDLAKAKTIAKEFFAKKGVEFTKNEASYRAPRKGAAQQKEAYYYIFNADNNHGYVIVSGDDRTEEILGYSDSGYIDTENMPENMRSWLQFYADKIQYIADKNIQTAPETSEAKNLRKGAKAHHSIAPILTCNWNQGDPYNQQCPEYYNGDGSTGRSATGCVATAIAQVLYHHKYPETTKNRIPAHSCSYKLNDGTTKISKMNAIAAGTAIDWDNMCDNYYGNETQEQKDAVAFLMALVGQSVKMGYGASSGSSYADSRKLFVNYLGYDDGVQILRSDNYGIQEWFEMMYDELDKGYPIAYGGSSTGGGHAFVVDGFDGDEFFHLNWGWGGGSNGYFRIDVLNPGDNSGIGASSSADGYSMGQDAILYLRGYDDGIDAGYEADTHASMNDLTINGTKIFLNYVNWTGSTNSFNTAIVTKNEAGEIVPVAGQETISNLGANYYVGKTVDMAGKFHEPGTYRITPANKLTSNKIWRTLFDLRNEYIRADVDEELKVTLARVSPTVDMDVEEWMFPGTLKAGDQQDVTVRLKNNGPEFKRELALYASKTTNMGNSVSRALIGVKSGDSDEFTFFFKPESAGTYNLWLTLNSDKNTVIGQTTVEIKNTAQNQANLKVSSVSIKNASYGDFLNGTMTVQNMSSKDFKGFVNIQLWHSPNGGTFWSGSSQRLYYEIPGGKTGTASFQFDNLEIGHKYRFAQQYVNQPGELSEGGVFAGSEYTLKNGVVTYTKYGTMTGTSVSTTFKGSASGAGARFYGVTPKSITPSSNPNFVYALIEGAEVPAGMEDYNIIVGNTAEKLTLVDNEVVYFPVDFTAKQATFSYTVEKACDGTSNWVPLTLPFKPAKVTIDGQEVTWTHDGTTGKFWIKEFSEINDDVEVIFDDASILRGGTPYLVGAPEDLVGKTIVFSAEDAFIKSQATDNMLVGSYAFNYYGNTYSPRLESVYSINEEGTAFIFNPETATQVPFRAYFTTKLAEAPEQIVIKFAQDTDVNGIFSVNVQNSSNRIYDLQGRQVKKTQKGIYIVDGKKRVY